MYGINVEARDIGKLKAELENFTPTATKAVEEIISTVVSTCNTLCSKIGQALNKVNKDKQDADYEWQQAKNAINELESKIKNPPLKQQQLPIYDGYGHITGYKMVSFIDTDAVVKLRQQLESEQTRQKNAEWAIQCAQQSQETLLQMKNKYSQVSYSLSVYSQEASSADKELQNGLRSIAIELSAIKRRVEEIDDVNFNVSFYPGGYISRIS